MAKSLRKIKRVEAETMKTFREEIPSRYFSHKTKVEYDRFSKNLDYVYRDLLKMPAQMFKGADLIDFGAGTGENTVQLANWGASCTLVEMNPDSHKISKWVFKRYAKKPKDHTFILSSIFDYKPRNKKQYDIVQCRGALSHTAGKEIAFQKIAGFVKPGGFFIFGDPNKSGGFQNMLQRFAVYHFAKTPNEMVDVSEYLFKEDIDRSERFVPRTRRAIIFDRWVIQSQDDPSVKEVLSWIKKAGMRLYSGYPQFTAPLQGDSVHHRPKFNVAEQPKLAALSELIWLSSTEADSKNVPRFADNIAPTNTALDHLSSYMANFNKNSKLEPKKFKKLSGALRTATTKLDYLKPLKNKISDILKEADGFVDAVYTSDLKKVRRYIENTKVLFKDAVGIRQADYVAYKPLSREG